MVAHGKGKYWMRYCIYSTSLFFILLSCGEKQMPWRLDSEYSMFLTIMAPNYKAMTYSDISDTVDAIRIYRINQKHDDMYSLSELFTKELVFETKDKKFIRKIILAAQDEIMHADCIRIQDQETYHVIAFDNTFMRAGYFIINICKGNGNEYGIVRPLQKRGGSSIYYNKSLIQIFKEELYIMKKKVE